MRIAAQLLETGLSPGYGISLYAGGGTVDGVRGDHVLLAPPFNVSTEEVDFIVDTTVRVVEDVFKRLN